MTGKVYFVSAPGRVKIGFTSKPENRLRQLQTIDMEQLSLIGIMDGSRKLERHIHELLAAHRLRGEWFRDCSEVRETVTAALRGEFSCDGAPSEIDKRAEQHDQKSATVAGIVRSSLDESWRLAAEIQRRLISGEPISDLVKSACFLAEKVIVPALSQGEPAEARS